MSYSTSYLDLRHFFKNSRRTISGILHWGSIWNYLLVFHYVSGASQVSGSFPGNHSWICITRARQSVSRAALARLLSANNHRAQANRNSSTQVQRQEQDKFFRTISVLPEGVLQRRDHLDTIVPLRFSVRLRPYLRSLSPIISIEEEYSR